jgi:hypothetical protein
VDRISCMEFNALHTVRRWRETLATRRESVPEEIEQSGQSNRHADADIIDYL